MYVNRYPGYGGQRGLGAAEVLRNVEQLLDNIPPDLDDAARKKKLKTKMDGVLETWRKCTAQAASVRRSDQGRDGRQGFEKEVDVVKDP